MAKDSKKSQVPSCPWRQPPVSVPRRAHRPSLRQQMGCVQFAYARGGSPSIWNQLRRLTRDQKEKVA